MDDRKGPISTLLAIPVLAIFLGVGILFARIALDWTPGNTQTVIGGGLAICGAGLAVFALVFGILAGIAVYKRLLLDRDSRPPAPGQQMERYQLQPYREPAPPMISAPGQQGSWLSNGPASYDIWQEEPEEAAWRAGT